LKAIHWLRSKLEENELGYWLSFVAYDQKDRTLINKVYLLYLVIFFFIWFLMVFFFFAKVGGMALSFLNPDQTANTAVSIAWAVLALWNLFGLLQSSRRSPVVFSETDQVLVCQTPVNRRSIVMRWLWMPWFKSALPFWCLALVLGFSTAELHFSGIEASSAFFSYVGFGIRALLLMIPIHLALYAFQWSIGILRLHKDVQKKWIMFPAIGLGMIPIGVLLINVANSFYFDTTTLNKFLNSANTDGSSSSPLLFAFLTALLMLVLLQSVSRYFNLSRAAQETSELEMLTTAAKYGFTDIVEQRRLQNRLSNNRKIELTAKYRGSAALIWRNRIQSQRAWSWKQALPLLTVFSIMLGLPLIPGLMSKFLALFFFVVQTGPILAQRLRSDLACWSILQQLPLRKTRILIHDLSSSLPILLTISFFGLIISAIVTKTVFLNYFFILPGLLATIGFTAAIDVLRKSRSDLLINGNVPSVGTQGILLGVIGTIVPIWLASTFNGPTGILLSTCTSLAIAWICFKFAVISFKNIK